MEWSRKLVTPLSSNAQDASAGRLICFAAGLLVLILGFITVGKLDAGAPTVFLATLLILSVALSCVVLGQLLWLTSTVRELRARTP